MRTRGDRGADTPEGKLILATVASMDASLGAGRGFLYAGASRACVRRLCKGLQIRKPQWVELLSGS